MGFIATTLIALAFASLILSSGGRRKIEAIPFILFFIILFMAGIASQYWINPIGPVVGGVSWVPLLFVIIFVSLLFISPAHGTNKTRPGETEEYKSAQISVFIWLLLFMLLLAIFIGLTKSKPL